MPTSVWIILGAMLTVALMVLAVNFKPRKLAIKEGPQDSFRIVQRGDKFYPQKRLWSQWCYFCLVVNKWDTTTLDNRRQFSTTYEDASDWLYRQIAKDEYEMPKTVLEFKVKRP